MPKVTQKGQVTIPQQIRIMLGIKTGDELNALRASLKKISDTDFTDYTA
jgi:AbrB family looped-hinge helix DNA binding protein